MPKSRLKICGITNLADARYCAAAGASYLGFVQYSGSPRYVEPRVAREIIEWVAGPEPVGVFVDEPPEVVNQIAREANFQLVQLHGDESVEDCRSIEFPVIKAIRVTDGMGEDDLFRYAKRYASVADYFLLDAFHPSLRGGSGSQFDWSLAVRLAQAYPIFLAGGIGSHNVADALETVRPFAVDLSSSVETAPGKKDFDKLADLFQRLETLNAES